MPGQGPQRQVRSQRKVSAEHSIEMSVGHGYCFEAVPGGVQPEEPAPVRAMHWHDSN